jgi:hypothetical protein
VDLGHDLVLAHGQCNGFKGDRLAAYAHLARWCQRNERVGATLDRAFAEAELLANRTMSNRVTRWAYEELAMTQGRVWESGETLVDLDPRWRQLFGRAA